MRDTGPVAKSLDQEGDTEAAATNIGTARTVLGQLGNQMRLGGLQVGVRNLTLPDGTVIRAVIAGGTKKIFISVPRRAGGSLIPAPEVSQPLPIPQLEVPRLTHMQIVIVLGSSTDNGGNIVMYPFEFGNNIYNQPKSSGRTLIMGPQDEYKFAQLIPPSPGGPPIDAVWLAIGVADENGTLVGDHATITCMTDKGVHIPILPAVVSNPPPIPSLIDVRSFNTAYAEQTFTPTGVSILGLNPAWTRTRLDFSAGALGNAFMLEGGAQVWVNNSNLGASIGIVFTVNGQPPQFNNSNVVPAGAIDIELSAIHGASGGSVIWGISFSIAYPNSLMSPEWGYLTGELYNPHGEVQSSSMTSYSFTIDRALIELDISFPASPGTYTLTGAITAGDGYGNTSTSTVSVTATVTAP